MSCLRPWRTLLQRTVSTSDGSVGGAEGATPESRLLSQQYDVQSSARSADPPTFLIFCSETFLLFIHHDLREAAPEWFVLRAVPSRFHYITCGDESAEICQSSVSNRVSVRVSQLEYWISCWCGWGRAQEEPGHVTGSLDATITRSQERTHLL